MQTVKIFHTAPRLAPQISHSNLGDTEISEILETLICFTQHFITILSRPVLCAHISWEFLHNAQKYFNIYFTLGSFNTSPRGFHFGKWKHFSCFVRWHNFMVKPTSPESWWKFPDRKCRLWPSVKRRRITRCPNSICQRFSANYWNFVTPYVSMPLVYSRVGIYSDTTITDTHSSCTRPPWEPPTPSNNRYI